VPGVTPVADAALLTLLCGSVADVLAFSVLLYTCVTDGIRVTATGESQLT